tara:strand:+ start:46 stop:498 length:453 start_codon:yes stop_codon:yes gene_type:complete
MAKNSYCLRENTGHAHDNEIYIPEGSPPPQDERDIIPVLPDIRDDSRLHRHVIERMLDVIEALCYTVQSLTYARLWDNVDLPPAPPPAMGPLDSQMGRTFGKKQKRWVADLKGKKKFVRRQVYSLRKDLVTPSYFEKMTGADFWKLPVAK